MNPDPKTSKAGWNSEPIQSTARWHASLRMRLLVGSLLVMLLALALLGWGLQALFTRHITSQLHAQLELHLNQLSAAVYKQPDGSIGVQQLNSSPQLEKPFSGLYWQVDALKHDGHYAPLARSRSLWDLVLQVPEKVHSDAIPISNADLNGVLHTAWQNASGQTLIAVLRPLKLPGATETLRLTVAAEQDLLAEPLGDFRTMLWSALAVLSAGLIVAAAVQLHLALRPLKLLKQGLEAVRAGQASLLQGEHPLELLPLVHEFNHVLQENADMVQRARTHAGNLAHAVHTPLSILANAAHAASDEERSLADLVQEQVATARQHVDYHLARARSAAAVRATGVATPLLEPIQALLRTMERLHSGRALSWSLEPFPEHWAFRGEAQDLYEMLGNVLDNAGKWANSSVQVQVGASDDAKSWSISVDDDGPGIPETVRQHMLQRGIRLDEQTPGSGLGLDIVHALLESYGGSIRMLSSPLGGLSVLLEIPKVESTRTS